MLEVPTETEPKLSGAGTTVTCGDVVAELAMPPPPHAEITMTAAQRATNREYRVNVITILPSQVNLLLRALGHDSLAVVSCPPQDGVSSLCTNEQTPGKQPKEAELESDQELQRSKLFPNATLRGWFFPIE